MNPDSDVITAPFHPNATREIQTQLNWVVSYPKSGNTWVRLVARAYSTGRPHLDGLGRIGDVHPRVWHDVSPLPVSQLTLTSEVQLRPAALLNLAILHENKETLLKSHHGHFAVQGLDLWKSKWVRRIINPVRDPRDVCCSAASHFGKSYEEAAAFMNREQTHIGGDDERDLHHFIGSWSQHVRSWLQSGLDVLTVRYEDLHEAPVQAFTEIMDFLLDEDVDRKRVEAAVKKCRFERLQKLEEEHDFAERSHKADKFFRKGEAGGWKNELPAEMADQVVEDHHEMMDELGYL